MVINVGLIGYGRYGKKYYANLLKDKYFRIVKILRKSKKKSNDLFTNNKKIFFKIKNIDLYIIASPTNSHYDYLKTALIKKKHIIIEKPLVGEFSQFTKIKGLIKKSKKIILINHTDLYMNAYLSLKKKIKKIGKIKSLKLIFGKIDPYPLKNITNKYKLPHFEWLPHPLAIMLDLIKDQNFKINLNEKRKIYKKKLYQDLEIFFSKNKINIEINFSNYFKKRKRNLEIHGTNGSLIYRGYDKKKCFFKKNNKISYLKTVKIDPLKNLLNSFKKKYKNQKFSDDKELIISTTKYLFKISNILKI